MGGNWKLWCRLCAYEDSSNININKFQNEFNFPDGLNNLLSLNIPEANELSSMICLNCNETVRKIIEFSQKVSRVQMMFLEILNGNGSLDAEQIKAQHKLNDEFDQKMIVLNPIEKLYEPEINILLDTTTETVDLLEPSNIKIEEDCPYGVKAEDVTTDESDQSSKNNDDQKSKMDTIEIKIKKPNATETQEPENSSFSGVKCIECHKTFLNLNRMKRHLKKQHGLLMRTFICEECGKICKSLALLEEHKIVHAGERPFKCQECGKCFKNKLRLKFHEDTHSTTSYICTICGIQLNSKRTLSRHMVVHSDQRRFKCDFCGNEYKRSKTLKAHLILHTGLKPYACNFCDRTFANTSNCRSHKKKSHPVELAEMEAAGKCNNYTKVPELKDLRASLQLREDIQNFNNS